MTALGRAVDAERKQIMEGASLDHSVPTTDTPDADLVDLCLERRPGAWEELVRRYASLVYSVPRQLGLSQEEAEDVSQQVFTSLLSAMPGLRDRQTLAKWLITVSNRQAWRVIRGRRQGPKAAGDTPESLGVAQDEAPDLGGWERRHAVRRALVRLGGRCQELLVALFSDRGTPDYAEIGQRLGMPVGSIGPTRNRCLRKLLEVLATESGATAVWSDAERAALARQREGGDSA